MDHSPKNPQEQERIAAAGGWVTNGRVNGVLGVSRSFGDIMYKSFSPEGAASPSDIEGDLANVWQPNYQVTSLPEVCPSASSLLTLVRPSSLWSSPLTNSSSWPRMVCGRSVPVWRS